MSGAVTVPGYTITGVAGIGGDGAVHRGTDADGRPVAIRVLTDAPAGLVARARAAAAVTHPGIAAVREVVERPGGGLAVVQAFVDGPTVSTLRAARRGLSVAECGQLATELLAALAALHAAGMIHGDVSPANVIVAPSEEQNGVPVLVDLVGGAGPDRGTRGFRAPEVDAGAAPGVAADVYSAARLSLWVAEPGAREQVGALLAPLLLAEPAERPSARDAQQLLDGGARVAIRLAPSEVLASATLREHAARELTTRARTRRARPRRRHRAQGRRRLVRVGAAVVLLGVLVGGLAWAGVPARLLDAAGEVGPPSQATVAPDADRPADGTGADGTAAGGTGDAATGVADAEGAEVDAAVVAAARDLLGGRDEALNARDAVALAAVTAPGSPLATADAAMVSDLTDAGVRLQGYRTEVLDLEVLSADPDEATVRAELQQAAYERVGPDGTAQQVPEQPAQCVQLRLEHSPEELTWRASTATPC